MRAAVHIIIAALCLPLGYVARDYLESNVDLSAKAVQAFRAYCVPFSKGRFVEPVRPFIQVPSVGETLWVNRHSKLSISMSNSRCKVSDQFGLMDAEEHAAIRRATLEIVAEDFPMLTLDTEVDQLGWEGFEFWSEFPFGHPRRWGVMLARPSVLGGDAPTSLIVAISRQTEAERTLFRQSDN